MNIHGIQSVGTLTQISGGFATLTGSFTGSFKGDGSGLTNLPLSPVDSSSLVTTASFNAYTSSTDGRLNNIETTTASLNTSVSQLNANSASQQVSIDALNVFTASQSTASIVTSINNLNSATASLFTSASLAIVTASVNDDDITFTKGDGTQFTIQVATGSFAVSASYAETASYAQFATDIYLNVKNTTGAQLNKGTVVRIIGATGDNALVATASWEDDNNSANTLGFLYENIANDGFGKVITQGTLLGINTDPTLGYAAGQILYLSSSGQYTNVKPPAPYHEVRLGQVLRAQLNNGSAYVLIQNGYELEELHDVDINTGSLANNNLLAYNSASGQWENKTLTQVGATTTSSFNAYTQSTDSRLTNIETTTGSLNTSASLALVTASFDNGTRNLSFTKGDTSIFSVNIPDLSGSTGNFATTGSNTFIGDQIISGTFIQSGSNSIMADPIGQGVGTWIQNRVVISDVSGAATPRLFISGSDGAYSEYGRGFITQDTRKVSGLGANIFTYAGIAAEGTNIVAVANDDYSVDVEMQIFANTSSVGLADWDNGSTFTYVPFMTLTPNNGDNPAPQFKRSVGITGSLDLSSTFTASLQQGYVWVGNASGRTTTVATSSFGGGGGASFPYSGSVEITGSVKVKPFTLTVSANTASINMNESNYFILNLPTSSTTHIAFTNIIPGESINLLVSQSATVATGSIAFAPNIYFPNGSDYQATSTGSARDIVSFITFNTNEVYATQIKNLY